MNVDLTSENLRKLEKLIEKKTALYPLAGGSKAKPRLENLRLRLRHGDNISKKEYKRGMVDVYTNFPIDITDL